MITALEHKLKVDGITRVVVPHKFQFDIAFGGTASNRDVCVSPGWW